MVKLYMAIRRISLRRKSIVLHDIDGSQVLLSLQGALELLDWLQQHKGEIETRLGKV